MYSFDQTCAERVPIQRSVANTSVLSRLTRQQSEGKPGQFPSPGKKLVASPPVSFPRCVNVHIVEIKSPGEVKTAPGTRLGNYPGLRHRRRLVCVAGVLTGRTGRKLLAHLPGGDLELNWPADTASVFMTGPAAEVFSGDWPD